MIYLTSTNECAIIDAEARISLNCGFPNDKGTARWAVPQKAINQDLWFIEKPNGYAEFTQEQMMQGVNMLEIVEQERNSNWFPVE